MCATGNMALQTEAWRSRSKETSQCSCKLLTPVRSPSPQRWIIYRPLSVKFVGIWINSMPGEAECRIEDTEGMAWEYSTEICMIQLKIKHLESKADDAENRSRHNNLRIVVLPEGAEGQNPVSFAERLLKILLLQSLFSAFFAIKRAHSMPNIGVTSPSSRCK